MQQHTGQHVLSAAIDKLFKVRTVSFHLGAEVSTIDIARELSASEIAAAETEANRIVWEDRPVTIHFADAEEAARMPLRKESIRGGTLRLIEVEDFDLSACGGTHVARTGGIGIIAAAAWERFKGGQRIEFVCGGRALTKYRGARDAVTASVRLLSVLPEELPGAIQRLQADAKDQKRAFAGLQEELAGFRAEEMAASGETTAHGRLVSHVVDADANGLKSLASAIAAKPGYIVVLVSRSRPVLIVAARSTDVTAVSAQQIVAALTSQFGGRGGGRPELAQAGGLDADPSRPARATRSQRNKPRHRAHRGRAGDSAGRRAAALCGRNQPKNRPSEPRFVLRLVSPHRPAAAGGSADSERAYVARHELPSVSVLFSGDPSLYLAPPELRQLHHDRIGGVRDRQGRRLEVVGHDRKHQRLAVGARHVTRDRADAGHRSGFRARVSLGRPSPSCASTASRRGPRSAATPRTALAAAGRDRCG